MLTRFLAWSDRVMAGEAQGRELLLVRLWAVAAVLGFFAASWTDSLAWKVLLAVPLLAILIALWLRDATRWRRSVGPWTRRVRWSAAAIAVGAMLGVVALDPHLRWLGKNPALVLAFLLVWPLSRLAAVARDRFPRASLWSGVLVSLAIAVVVLRADASLGVKTLLMVAWISVSIAGMTPEPVASTQQQDLPSPSL